MCSSQLLYNIVLLVGVVFVTFTLVKSSDGQQQSAQKRGQGNNTPATLNDVVKMLQNFEKRIIQIESKQAMALRGRDGRDGKDGKDGLPGSPGRDGKNGRDGLPGRDGKNGIGQPGTPGPRGVKGMTGQPGPPGPASGGVQYVRWGKTTCPSGADLVYKGRIGGGYYKTKGGGSNYVCLPETPKYGNYKDGASNHAYMYGTEYEISYSPFRKSSLHDNDAPCAVCYSTKRSSKLMIPATYECPAGWTREYHGYLMADHHVYKATEFICVDEDAEAVPGSKTGVDGALLYLVVGKCGVLPCQPYVEGRQLTCAVCTK